MHNKTYLLKNALRLVTENICLIVLLGNNVCIQNEKEKH